MNWGSTAPLFIVSLSTSCPPASQGSVGVNSFPHLPECRDELDSLDSWDLAMDQYLWIHTINIGGWIHIHFNPAILMWTKGALAYAGMPTSGLSDPIHSRLYHVEH